MPFLDVGEERDYELDSPGEYGLPALCLLEVVHGGARVVVAAADAVAADEVERGQKVRLVGAQHGLAQLQVGLLVQVNGMHHLDGILEPIRIEQYCGIDAKIGMDGDGARVLHVFRRGKAEQKGEPCAAELVEGLEPCAFAVGILGDRLLEVERRKQPEREPLGGVVDDFLGNVRRLGREYKDLLRVVVVPVGVAKVLDDVGQGVPVFLVGHFLLQLRLSQVVGGRKVQGAVFEDMLPQLSAKVEFRGVVAMGVGRLVEPDVVLRTRGQVALDANLVLVLGLGKEGAGPVGTFLVRTPHKLRFKVAVGSRRHLLAANPFVLGFLYVGVVRDDRVQGIFEG